MQLYCGEIPSKSLMLSLTQLNGTTSMHQRSYLIAGCLMHCHLSLYLKEFNRQVISCRYCPSHLIVCVPSSQCIPVKMAPHLFRAHGEFCASHPWEVIVATLTLTACFVTVERQHLPHGLKTTSRYCNDCLHEVYA